MFFARFFTFNPCKFAIFLSIYFVTHNKHAEKCAAFVRTWFFCPFCALNLSDISSRQFVFLCDSCGRIRAIELNHSLARSLGYELNQIGTHDAHQNDNNNNKRNVNPRKWHSVDSNLCVCVFFFLCWLLGSLFHRNRTKGTNEYDKRKMWKEFHG